MKKVLFLRPNSSPFVFKSCVTKLKVGLYIRLNDDVAIMLSNSVANLTISIISLQTH